LENNFLSGYFFRVVGRSRLLYDVVSQTVRVHLIECLGKLSPSPGGFFKNMTVGVWAIGSLAHFPSNERRQDFFKTGAGKIILRSHLTF